MLAGARSGRRPPAGFGSCGRRRGGSVECRGWDLDGHASPPAAVHFVLAQGGRAKS